MAYPDNKLVFRKSKMILEAYSDASFATISEGRSRLGGALMFGNGPDSNFMNGLAHVICSTSDVVMGSIMEAEYGATYLTGKDVVYMRQIARSLGFPQSGPTEIKNDNSCAVHLSNDSLKISKSKAIDMRFHWIRDRVRQKQITVKWIPAADNIADFFTKAPPVHQHVHRMRMLVHADIRNRKRAARCSAWRSNTSRSA